MLYRLTIAKTSKRTASISIALVQQGILIPFALPTVRRHRTPLSRSRTFRSIVQSLQSQSRLLSRTVEKMTKMVLKLNIHDDKDKKRVLQTVSSFPGIDSLAVDMNESKLIITGEFELVKVVMKLRKQWKVEVVTIGPAKEEKKVDDNKGGDNKGRS